jgi:putative ABC transport system permease protein
LTVLFTIYLIERNLDATFVSAYPEDAPNIVLLDIQPDQRQEVREVLGSDIEFVPLIQARIKQINGVEVVRQEQAEPNQNRGPGPNEPIRLDAIFPITYRDTLAPSEKLVQGQALFSSQEPGLAQVSITQAMLDVHPFVLGDRIQFEIQGVPLDAQITSIRAHDDEQEGFGPVFNFVLREQDLINAPQTIVTVTSMPEEQIPQFQNELVAAFPNITVINISAAIDTFAQLVGDITVVIRFFTIFSIVAGVLIILSSVLATRFARIQESVYFKVLGAKRRFVMRVFALENIFIGLLSAVLALFLSQLASWILITQIFELSYGAYWGSSFLLMLFAVVLVTTVGLLASISILRKKPITFLREQTVE